VPWLAGRSRTGGPAKSTLLTSSGPAGRPSNLTRCRPRDFGWHDRQLWRQANLRHSIVESVRQAPMPSRDAAPELPRRGCYRNTGRPCAPDETASDLRNHEHDGHAGK
jgi:hypothetical protein